MVGNGGRRLAAHDFGIVAGGLLAFIAGFLPWYGVSVAGYSQSVAGWHSGFTASLPLVVCVAFTFGVVLQEGFRVGTRRSRFQSAMLPTILTVASVILVLLRWLTLPEVGDVAGIHVDSGARPGLYVGLIATVVVAVFAVRRLLTFRGEPGPGAAALPPANWPQNSR